MWAFIYTLNQNRKRKLFMTNKQILFTGSDTINDESDGKYLYNVSTPTNVSIVGNYPIHDEKGNLYSLSEHKMSVFYEQHGDACTYILGDKAYLPFTSGYEFIVSENEETAFLTMLLTFKVYANSEDEACEKLAYKIAEEGSQLNDFEMYDFKRKAVYKVDILMYDVSHLYNAIQATNDDVHEAEIG